MCPSQGKGQILATAKTHTLQTLETILVKLQSRHQRKTESCCYVNKTFDPSIKFGKMKIYTVAFNLPF
jgi:hypothetical protein